MGDELHRLFAQQAVALHADGHLTDAELADVRTAYEKYRLAAGDCAAALARMGPADPLAEEIVLYQAAMSLYANDIREVVWRGLKRKDGAS